MRFVMAPLIVLVFLLTNNGLRVLSAPATTYDQQQTGQLNFQLHLKDIQIVALLDSGLLGDYSGDYDYAYDYTDFTVKPTTTSSATTTSPSTLATSIKPWHTWPTIAPSATITEATASKIPENPSDSPVSESPKPVEQLAEIAVESKPADDNNKGEDSDQPAKNASALSSDESIKEPELVPLLELAHPTSEKKISSGIIKEKIAVDKEAIPDAQIPDSVVKSSPSSQVDSSSVLVPESSADTTEQSGNGEASTDQSQKTQKRCSPGQTKDQKGRCRLHIRRRVASSLLPFGIRLAPKLHRRRDLHVPSVIPTDDEY